ncbi:uncharacterized protein LOC124135598 [Haliotis rufescens]|uniref:uncharacterized protein LOC124135598 n=1 Tax=Haliotis rufescens TaxID=6454 RepID=UPI00201F5151|nr:uncharacterized protein LOC124135598 [Haliotis rufescens]XP_046356945.2 uncharacterized protein LOC124135598 [Haliotis rufescens]XP_046356946.2 uncharacterized protein LOC124135598 [Haliotis rufescens]XP_046356947.2 uncharacterized protein LOC124135598 [Haliotis rufescens]XP_046356948.2 uncharacterized protein LOC124135598 [Haliotis rufescens]
MVNPLLTISIITMYLETLLISYLTTELHDHMAFFITYIVIILLSFVLTNTSSAMMVRTSMDFSDKSFGKLLCFVLHLCQFGLAWRFGKLIFLYDKRDWLEMTSLRLTHVAIQTLPFLALHGCLTFSTMTIKAVPVLTLSVALLSASISLTMFCVREQLHSCSWNDDTGVPTGNAKRYCGIFLLLLGTTLALTARFACIVLMNLAAPYFVLILLALHMVFLIFGYMSCKAVKSESLVLKDVLMRIGLSFLNIFDLVEKDIYKVQCKYVSFYTVILVENITMVAVWLLKAEADYDYITKLIVIVTVLALYICALILKFMSCGFIIPPSNVQLIQSETPDQATILESNNIIKGIPAIPSISSNIDNHHDTSDGKTQTTQHGLPARGKDQSSRSSPRLPFPGEGVAERIPFREGETRSGEASMCCGRVSGRTVSVDPRPSDTPTDYGTYRTGTQESCSIDDPTRVSKYASQAPAALNVESQPRLPRKGHKFILGKSGTNGRARNRSEVSLDICSSNSRNTNTVGTSLVGTSETSGVIASRGDISNDNRCVVQRRTNKSSMWQKLQLRLPSMSHFLVTSGKQSGVKEPEASREIKVISPEEFKWNDNDTMTASTNTFRHAHQKLSGRTSSQSLTGGTNFTAVCVGSSRTKVKDTKQVRQLTKEDCVKMWLANVEYTQPMPSCQCSSESHSSDCTYVLPPDTRSKDVPNFEDFLAEVPPHPEMTSCRPSRNRHKSESCVRENSELQLNCQTRFKPIKHKRSFSETCSDSSAMFELQPIWLTSHQSGTQLQSDNEPVVPFIVKLGAMESLV